MMFEAGRGHPLRDCLGRKSEAAVGMLLTQKLKIVRREIDHQQPPTGLEHACGLADRAGTVIEEVQHLMNDDGIERGRRKCEIVDVALAHAAIFQTRAFEGARNRKHIERKVDTETAFDLGPNN
jgi:hypothetical protein